MNANSVALNLLPETQKRVVPYCKSAFGNVAPTLKLLGLGGMRRGMFLTFSKVAGWRLVSSLLPIFPRLWLPDPVAGLVIPLGWCTKVDPVVGIYPLSKYVGANPVAVWGVVL